MERVSSITFVLVSFAISPHLGAESEMSDMFSLLEQVERKQAADETPPQAEVQATAERASAVPTAVSEPIDKPESDLFSRGVGFYRAGDYEKAEMVFEAVLAEEPYNRRAMEYLQRTAKRIAAISATKQSASRAQAFAEIGKSWTPEPKVHGLDLGEEDELEQDAEDLGIAAMVDRVKQVEIQSLDFRDATIRDVVIFLTETCRRQDASGEGINILVLGKDDMTSVNNITISIRNVNLYEVLQYITEMASLKFDVQEKAVVIMPVGYVAASDLRLASYNVIPEVGAELESMVGGDSADSLDDLFGDSSETSVGGPIDVVNFFPIVDWPEGSSAIYQPNFHKLFVKNTKRNLDAVQDILNGLEEEAIKRRSQQVEIEAKFVEYNEGALEELGFDWILYDNGRLGDFSLPNRGNFFTRGTSYRDRDGTFLEGDDGDYIYTDPVTGVRIVGSRDEQQGQSLFGSALRDNTTAFDSVQSGLAGLLGGAPGTLLLQNDGAISFDLAITAMEQEGTADVLSAPRVTTKSGNEAIIRVVEEHRYPRDYDIETGQRTAPVVRPQDWEDYDLGVVLKVTPVVDTESNTIDLDLQPEITEFKDYDNYVLGYNAYDVGGNNNVEIGGNGEVLYARMPYFEKRSVETQVTIADGSTVVMGGLVDERTESFRDQVPFLGDIPYIGRFFRSEGSRTQKKNLIITVKATQVDDRGMTRDQRELARKNPAN